MLKYEDAVEQVTNLLWDMIALGGGNGGTIADFAERITDLFYEEGTDA